MELTDVEREEFNALANATLDPDLWDENDLPFLRAARAEHDREREREHDGLYLVPQSSQTEDDEAHTSERGWPQ